jgi:membrane protein DedA with SNARE-associated domain
MLYHTFTAFNAGGGLLWSAGVTVLGYFLGQVAFVRSNPDRHRGDLLRADRSGTDPCP